MPLATTRGYDEHTGEGKPGAWRPQCGSWRPRGIWKALLNTWEGLSKWHPHQRGRDEEDLPPAKLPIALQLPTRPELILSKASLRGTDCFTYRLNITSSDSK